MFKNFQKRRVVCGAHEALSKVQRGKAQLVFYAKNLDENNRRAASNVHQLQKQCPLEGIPLIEALTRKEMSRVMNKFPYVGVVAVTDFSGFEKEAQEIIKLWRQSDSFKLHHIDQSSILP